VRLARVAVQGGIQNKKRKKRAGEEREKDEDNAACIGWC